MRHTKTSMLAGLLGTLPTMPMGLAPTPRRYRSASNGERNKRWAAEKRKRRNRMRNRMAKLSRRASR